MIYDLKCGKQSLFLFVIKSLRFYYFSNNYSNYARVSFQPIILREKYDLRNKVITQSFTRMSYFTLGNFLHNFQQAFLIKYNFVLYA